MLNFPSLLNVNHAKRARLGFPVPLVIYEDLLRNPEISITLVPFKFVVYELSTFFPSISSDI